MRMPWTKVKPAEPDQQDYQEKEAASRASFRRRHRELYAPSGRARAILRRHHPQLTEAERARDAALDRLQVATVEAADLDTESRRLADGVGSGRATVETAEAGLIGAKRAALRLPSLEAEVLEAEAAVEREERVAAAAVAAWARGRRAEMARQVVKVVPIIEAALEAETALEAELEGLRTQSGRDLLAGLDLGEAPRWPACSWDDGQLRGAIMRRPQK